MEGVTFVSRALLLWFYFKGKTSFSAARTNVAVDVLAKKPLDLLEIHNL